MIFESNKYGKSKVANSVVLNDFFTNGIQTEKNKKIKLRNDLNLVFYPGGRYIEKKKAVKIDNSLVHRLRDGSNLFEYPESEFKQRRDIFEIKLIEINDFNIEKLSTLPNLSSLIIRFSTLKLNTQLKITTNFFLNLENIDLTFNSLSSDIFKTLILIKSLKKINLMGNFIETILIDISALCNLEELNLSHNRIESHYLEENPQEMIESLEETQQIDTNRVLGNFAIINTNEEIIETSNNESSKK